MRHILQELLKEFLSKCCFLHVNLLLPCSLFFWKRKGVSVFLGPSHQEGGREGVKKKKRGKYYTALYKNTQFPGDTHCTDTITTLMSAVMQ